VCGQLKEAKERRALLVQTISSCDEEEKDIMGSTQSIVMSRRMEDSRLLRTIAASTLEMDRGFKMDPSSTFHQHNKTIGGTSTKFPPL
jgi:hypothetical protein